MEQRQCLKLSQSKTKKNYEKITIKIVVFVRLFFGVADDVCARKEIEFRCTFENHISYKA